jgi:hypothetical protein
MNENIGFRKKVFFQMLLLSNLILDFGLPIQPFCKLRPIILERMGEKSIAGSRDLKIKMKLFSFGRQTVKEIMTTSAYCAVLVTYLCFEYYLPPRLSVTTNSVLYI